MSTGLFAYSDGQFIAEENAIVSARDLSVQRGYGIFDYLRVKNNQPLHLDDHLARFFSSAAELRLANGFTKEGLTEIVFELINRNNLPESGIRLTLTGGISKDSYSIGNPVLLVTQSPLQMPSPEIFQKGLKLITCQHQRQLPHVKTIDYLLPIYLQPLIREKGADDVLYHQEFVTECPRANFFIVTKEKRILTPQKNILKGITRQQLLKLKDLPITETDIRLQDIADAEEAFITSTTKGILPVSRIDDHSFQSPGPVTAALHQQLAFI
jgi:branched-chain amino acid aminotransferase